MQLALLGIAFVALIAVGYRLYGRWVERQLQVDDTRRTPAHQVNDGVDYVPTRPFYLFGQHFAAIAAAGPIAGPILACQAWGWLPCMVWIALGVVLIGAVHDFATLAASVRHDAKSIAEIARAQLGRPAGTALMAFIWIALVYVIVAFTQITAGSFAVASEELAGRPIDFHPGGAVAAAAVMYLGLALLLGVVQRYLKPPLWLATIIFVPATLFVVWLGTRISHHFVLDGKTWGLLILLYCCVASVTPVWALLQPRGYLGGFVLFLVLAAGVTGGLFGGHEIRHDAFRTWDTGTPTGMLFPFLFVTIACGACSGFHGLVCSGTTSKQVDRESHMRPVGYGGMLAEGLVAVIALATIMIASSDEVEGLTPGTIYGNGIGRFLIVLLEKAAWLWESMGGSISPGWSAEDHLPFAVTFGAMAFSTFVFDTLDICMRLGRYLLQEISGLRGAVSSLVTTIATAAPPAYFVAFAGQTGWRDFWTLFGASNQLLAALSLLAISVWLYKARARVAFTLLPMAFVLVITLWSLVSLSIGSLGSAHGFDVPAVNGLVALVLVGLALFLTGSALWKLRAERASSHSG